MTEAVIAALIAAAASIIGQLIISKRSKDKDNAERAAKEQSLEDRLTRIEETQHQTKADNDARLDRIEKKLDEHNHYAAKLTAIETDLRWLKESAGK